MVFVPLAQKSVRRGKRIHKHGAERETHGSILQLILNIHSLPKHRNNSVGYEFVEVERDHQDVQLILANFVLALCPFFTISNCHGLWNLQMLLLQLGKPSISIAPQSIVHLKLFYKLMLHLCRSTHFSFMFQHDLTPNDESSFVNITQICNITCLTHITTYSFL